MVSRQLKWGWRAETDGPSGRCSFEAGHRHVDVSKVIWLGTSNIGHDLVFEHQDHRPAPETQLSREEYIDLMALLRPRVSERLGVRRLKLLLERH